MKGTRLLIGYIMALLVGGALALLHGCVRWPGQDQYETRYPQAITINTNR